VKNHTIAAHTISNVLAVMQSYFTLSLEEKMQLDIRSTPNFKGYNAVLTSNNDPEGKGDMHEGFEFGLEALEVAGVRDVDRTKELGAMEGGNVWPQRPEGFREACLGY
jgi:isopenicillin N synthase-like dioxygenase